MKTNIYIQNLINTINNLPGKSGADIHLRANILCLLVNSYKYPEMETRAKEKAEKYIKEYFSRAA